MQAAHRLTWPADDSILLVVTDGANYNQSVRQVATTLAQRFQHGVYITANRPFHILRDSLERAGVPQGRLQFVDCVSGLTGLPPVPDPAVLHVESPTFLDHIAARAEQALKGMPADSRFLVLDSLSTLSVYNGTAPVRDMAHRLIARLRSLRTPAALLLVERQAGEGLLESLRPLCDAVVRA